MNAITFSISFFFSLFPGYDDTVKHFINARGEKVISGKAQLFEEGPIVKYFYNLFSCRFTIYCLEYTLYNQRVFSLDAIRFAIHEARKQFFTVQIEDSFLDEDVSFLETDKGKRCNKYNTSKKAIPDNQRGQNERRKMCRARKTGTKYPDNSYRGIFPDYEVINNNGRFRGRTIHQLRDLELEQENYFEFPTHTNNSSHSEDNSHYPYACEGMNILVHENGETGAISFNRNYLGIRIIRAA